MIESVRFDNFKVLQAASLPLGRLTVLVGPNGSGKSTVFQALQSLTRPDQVNYNSVSTVGSEAGHVKVTIEWASPYDGIISKTSWGPTGYNPISYEDVKQPKNSRLSKQDRENLNRTLTLLKVYSFDARILSHSDQIQPNVELGPSGEHLVSVIDQLRDNDPERFERLNEELGHWLPEFDRISFKTPNPGSRTLLLRTREGRHFIEAKDVSQGTLLALAFLTLAYVANPPPIVCIEEPDRGIHPRLLRDVRDALYRLSHPDKYLEKRAPTQVLLTTHSPYFLDLFKDHPEEVVVANRTKNGVHFERLSDHPDIEDTLGEIHLGEAWYSGILGGIPQEH